MAETLPEPLNEREQEILNCLADGLSNQEIARKLFLAEQTVRWYNSQIYSKLGVNKRKEALERAQALGLLRESAPIPIVSGKHNIPLQATPFIGRENELTELSRLLKDENTRLITILAPGGMGKTRLALEAARLQIGRYADGVILVPLAPLSSASDIVTTIAENIGFVFHGENTPAQQLTDFLRDRSMFLVLDNFEHLMDGVPLVADVIQAVHQVRLMVTSRERLNLRGETVYSLRGLDFPTWETPEDALQYDAVKLFMQSANHVRADFQLQATDLDYLARICRLTAGLPLGIELAAGWVDVLSLEQIANEIQNGIDILETEMRDVPERQRSIRATFDHTWDRLTHDEQAVFMRLSIFRGGFTIQAAQVVAGASIRGLRQLANKALIQVSANGRYDIHELLRQFGAEKLTTSGEQSATQAAHADYFANFMAERKQDMITNRQIEALELIDPDIENVRSAWFYIVNRQHWEQLPKFLHSLWIYLDIRTRGQGAVELLEPALKILQSSPASPNIELAMGRVLARLGWFTNDIGFIQKATDMTDEAIRILRQYDSPDDLLTALFSRGVLSVFLNDGETNLEVSQEGLNLAQSIGSNYWERYFGQRLALAYLPNDPELALQLAENALESCKQFQDYFCTCFTYGALIIITETRKDIERTAQCAEACLLLSKTLNHIFGIGTSFCAIGKTDLFKKDYAMAGMNLKHSLQVFWDGGYKWPLIDPLTASLP